MSEECSIGGMDDDGWAIRCEVAWKDGGRWDMRRRKREKEWPWSEGEGEAQRRGESEEVCRASELNEEVEFALTLLTRFVSTTSLPL